MKYTMTILLLLIYGVSLSQEISGEAHYISTTSSEFSKNLSAEKIKQKKERLKKVVPKRIDSAV